MQGSRAKKTSNVFYLPPKWTLKIANLEMLKIPTVQLRHANIALILCGQTPKGGALDSSFLLNKQINKKLTIINDIP